MSEPMVFDTHCHLDMDEFKDDLPEVIANARDAGLSGAVCVASTSETYGRTRQIVMANDEFWAAYGLSPFEADMWQEKESILREFLVADKAVAVGECGLDFYHDVFSPQTQLGAFRGQLEFAGRLDLPIIIHCRDAWGEVRREVDYAIGKFPALTGVLHCFTGMPDDARFFISRGFFISFAGNLTYPKAANLHESLRQIDLDFVLFETDSPYLSPIPFRGERNEPSRMVHTVKFGAELIGMDFDELSARSAENARRLFRRIL